MKNSISIDNKETLGMVKELAQSTQEEREKRLPSKLLLKDIIPWAG